MLRTHLQLLDQFPGRAGVAKAVPDANGANGGYYPDNVDPYSNSEVYGAKQAAS